MKQFLEHAWFRFLAAAVIASVTVVTVVGLGIRYYDQPDDDPLPPEFEWVNVVDLADNPALAEAIRKEREKNGRPENEPPPPPVLPERMVTGFVHVEYIVNPDGSVSNVRVVGAAPSGVYEDRAIAEVSRSMHAPAYNDDGEAIARRATEIIEFSVPASELANRELNSR